MIGEAVGVYDRMVVYNRSHKARMMTAGHVRAATRKGRGISIESRTGIGIDGMDGIIERR